MSVLNEGQVQHPILGQPGHYYLGSRGNGRARAVPRRHQRIQRDSVQGISKPAIRRLAHRGGVGRISTGVYGQIRKAMKDRISEIMKVVHVVLEHEDRKTVMTRDVTFALEKVGTPIYGFGSNEFLRRHKEPLVDGH